MKKKTTFVLAIAVVVLSCAGYSKATVLGTIEYNGAGNGLGEFTEMNFAIGYPIKGAGVEEGAIFNTSLSISLFWNVTEADVGKTVFACAHTHETFDDFISF